MRRGFFLLLAGAVMSAHSPVWATDPGEEQTGDSQLGITEEFDKMFSSPYQEADYYRTDRLLLTATKHIMEARKAPAIASVITEADIRYMGARSLLDILKRVPGIGVGISDLPTKQAIEVRGVRTKNTEKILFLINGHRMNNNLTGSAINIIDDLAVENIHQVEIVRGPGSALYGANAFVAVINIVTKSVEDFEGVQLTAGAGDFSTQHYNVVFGHEGDEVSVTGSFDYFDTNGAASLIEADAQTVNDAAQGTRASLAPGTTSEWENKKDLSLSLSYGDFTLNGRVIDKEKGPYIGVGRALNDETVQQFTHVSGSLEYSKRFEDVLDLNVRLYADTFDWDTYWEIFPEGFAGIYTTGYIGNPVTTNDTFGVDITGNYLYNDHLLTLGCNVEQARQHLTQSFNNFTNPGGAVLNTTATANFNQDVDRSFWALYIQDVWQIRPDLSLTLGLRHDNYSDFGGTTNPRLGLVWELNEQLTMKLLYGSAFRAPTFTEQFTINNPAEVGSENLEPETIDTYEASVEYHFTKNYSLSVNYFHNVIDDLITLGAKTSPTAPAPYINRAGQTTVDGVEVEFIADFGRDKYGYLNFSFQDTEDEEGNPLADVAEVKGNIGVNYGINQYLNFNANLNWIGERRRSSDDIRDDLESAALVDITLIAHNFYDALELRASIYNLLDEEYLDPSPNLLIPNDYPNNARTFVLEARYTF